MNRLLVAAIIGLSAVGPAAGQDYDPFLSAHDSMSQQQSTTMDTQLGNHLLRESLRRNRSRSRNRHGVTRGQMAACAKKSSYRAQYGAGNAKVRRLYSLCRGIGR